MPSLAVSACAAYHAPSPDAWRVRCFVAGAIMNATCRIAILASVTALGMTSPQPGRANRQRDVAVERDPAQNQRESGRVTLDVRMPRTTTWNTLVLLKTDLADDTASCPQRPGAGAQVEKIGEVEDIAPGKRAIHARARTLRADLQQAGTLCGRHAYRACRHAVRMPCRHAVNRLAEPNAPGTGARDRYRRLRHVARRVRRRPGHCFTPSIGASAASRRSIPQS